MIKNMQYETILAALADKVQEQANKIGYLEWKCEELSQKLKEAEMPKEKLNI